VINVAIIGLFNFVIGYFFVKFFARFIFKPLTAHWFALGISSSIIIGTYSSTFMYVEKLSTSSMVSTIFFEELLPVLLLFSLIALNLVVLPCIYWRDKVLAEKQTDSAIRIPENALHALAFSGGFIGALIGQKVFNHKVSKQSFRTKHYIVCVISGLIYVSAAYLYFAPNS